MYLIKPARGNGVIYQATTVRATTRTIANISPEATRMFFNRINKSTFL